MAPHLVDPFDPCVPSGTGTNGRRQTATGIPASGELNSRTRGSTCAFRPGRRLAFVVIGWLCGRGRGRRRRVEFPGEQGGDGAERMPQAPALAGVRAREIGRNGTIRAKTPVSATGTGGGVRLCSGPHDKAGRCQRHGIDPAARTRTAPRGADRGRTGVTGEPHVIGGAGGRFRRSYTARFQPDESAGGWPEACASRWPAMAS
jgi:hypothetical protein